MMDNQASKVERAEGVRLRREGDDSFLLYHPRTDELHLVTAAGKALFELCDGRSIDEVVTAGASLLGEAEGDVEAGVVQFLRALHKRSLVQFS